MKSQMNEKFIRINVGHYIDSLFQLIRFEFLVKINAWIVTTVKHKIKFDVFDSVFIYT